MKIKEALLRLESFYFYDELKDRGNFEMRTVILPRWGVDFKRPSLWRHEKPIFAKGSAILCVALYSLLCFPFFYCVFKRRAQMELFRRILVDGCSCLFRF